MVIDPKGTVLTWNPAAQAILEKRFGWIGTEASDVRSLPWEIRAGIEYLWEACRRGASQSPPPSLTLVSPDLYLHLSVLLRDEDDGGRGSKKKMYGVVVLKGSEPSVTRLWEGRARLTPREEEVLQWLAKGKSRKEISVILKVSEATVRTHLEHLYVKLGVTNRMEAAGAAMQQQLTNGLTATLQLS
ncbi:MAG: helix-turn-helix transcriptional regulator [Nitrospinae bacterium]|nr:helix-turn-helix transcriptional regulator [Nitrospinota bacterium]